MGDRFELKVVCPRCGLVDDEVYYAPTCGFVSWVCECGYRVDLEEYTGIMMEDCARTQAGLDEIKNIKKKRRVKKNDK